MSVNQDYSVENLLGYILHKHIRIYIVWDDSYIGVLE